MIDIYHLNMKLFLNSILHIPLSTYNQKDEVKNRYNLEFWNNFTIYDK